MDNLGYTIMMIGVFVGLALIVRALSIFGLTAAGGERAVRAPLRPLTLCVTGVATPAAETS
jgi:hypothetical protein